MRLALPPVLAAVAIAAAVLGVATFRHQPPKAPPAWRGTTTVFAVPLAGGRPREVRRLRGQWGFPVGTADGKAIVLERPFFDRTEVWRVPLGGGPPVRLDRLRVFRQPGRDTSSAARFDWLRRVPHFVADWAVAPDGRSVVVPRDAGLEVLTAHGSRYLTRGGTFAEPGFSADGKTVYVVRMNDATAIPK